MTLEGEGGRQRAHETQTKDMQRPKNHLASDQRTLSATTLEVVPPGSSPKAQPGVEGAMEGTEQESTRGGDAERTGDAMMHERLGRCNPTHADYLMAGSDDELIDRTMGESPNVPVPHMQPSGTRAGSDQNGDDEDDDGQRLSDEERALTPSPALQGRGREREEKRRKSTCSGMIWWRP